MPSVQQPGNWRVGFQNMSLSNQPESLLSSSSFEMPYQNRYLVCVCVCVCVCVYVLSRVRLFATPWTIALQASLSMEFSRQEYWSGLFPPPGDLPWIKPKSPALQADSSPLRYSNPYYYCCELLEPNNDPKSIIWDKMHLLSHSFFWARNSGLAYLGGSDCVMKRQSRCQLEGLPSWSSG